MFLVFIIFNVIIVTNNYIFYATTLDISKNII